MKKIGYIRRVPFEKIGIGKWIFYRYLDGRIILNKVCEDGEEKLEKEFENVEELRMLGKKSGFYGADLSYICKFLS